MKNQSRLWLNDGSCVWLRPEHKDHVWAYDFVHARTHDGRPLRLLVIVDEHTRECLSIDVARKLTSDDLLERLAWPMATRGVPENIRSDNGPEFMAKVVRAWLGKVGVKTLSIEPGSPWENGYVESFNGKLRDELLNRESFETLLEARVLIERWRDYYNTVRPHSALGYRAPAPERSLQARPPLRSGRACSGERTPPNSHTLWTERGGKVTSWLLRTSCWTLVFRCSQSDARSARKAALSPDLVPPTY